MSFPDDPKTQGEPMKKSPNLFLSFIPGFPAPLSPLESVVEPIPNSLASFFRLRPRLRRHCWIFNSKVDIASEIRSYPRNLIILGISRKAGRPLFFSWLVIVLVVTPNNFAAYF